MDYKELLKKYNILLDENNRLTEENKRLKAKLGIIRSDTDIIKNNITAARSIHDVRPTDNSQLPEINNKSDSFSKIKLFMSLFKGREDIYAKRWENKNKGTSGYSPVCLNEWQPGLCTKQKIPCSKCENKFYAALARKFGTALITCSMGRRHQIQFKSYDRLFPSQDTMPMRNISMA